MVEIHSDDIFLVSYPKSGNTWLRFLIGNYLTNNQCDFTNSHLIVPDVHYNPEQIDSLNKPRFIKSHLPFTEDYRRVIYIVRDGRDVAVSYYFHALKFNLIDGRTTFSDFVLKIIDNNLIDYFTPWSNHVLSWLDKKSDGFLLIRYEDMKANTENEFRRILEYSGIPIDQSNLIQAIEASSFKTMQQLEHSQTASFERLKNSDTNIRFVREGKIGDWDHFFSDELLEYFIKAHGLALEKLGYLSPRVTSCLEIKNHLFEQLEKETNSLADRLSQKEIAYQQLSANLENSYAQCQALQIELNHMQNNFEQAQTLVQHSKLQLEQRQIQQQQLENRLAEEQERSKKYQKKLAEVRERSKKRQKNLRIQLEQVQATLKEIESSKFWKLRAYWLKLKRSFGRLIAKNNFIHHQLQEDNVEIMSPLTQTNRVTLLAILQAQQVIETWQKSFQIDITSELENQQQIYLYECDQTKLRFFLPNSIAGSEELYAQLEKFDWYYMPDKWEYDVALTDLRYCQDVLEIGSGKGYFVKRLRQELQTNALGVELNSKAAETARQQDIPILNLNLEDIVTDYPNHFDAVCAFQVLEHLPDPKSFLTNAITVLRNNGKLILSVPNADAFPKHIGQDNLLDYPPHHLTQWTATTFHRLTRIFPLKLEQIRFEPLAEYHVDFYTSVLKIRFANSRFAKYKIVEYQVIRLINWLQSLLKNHSSIRRLIKGHTLYACFRKQ